MTNDIDCVRYRLLVLVQVGGGGVRRCWVIYLFILDSWSLQRVAIRKIIRQKHYFGPYILRLQSIWSLYFDNSQFGSYYFQLTVNLVSTINSLTENAYVTNDGHS